MKKLLIKRQQGGKLVLPNDGTLVDKSNINAKIFTHEVVQNLSDLSEAEFQNKYKTSKHMYKYDNYPEYKNESQKIGKENAKLYGSIDYPDSDVRSKNFGGYSNMFFLTPNQQGTPLAKELQEQTGDIITAALPLPSFKLVNSLKFKPTPGNWYRQFGESAFDALKAEGKLPLPESLLSKSIREGNVSKGINLTKSHEGLYFKKDDLYFKKGVPNTEYMIETSLSDEFFQPALNNRVKKDLIASGGVGELKANLSGATDLSNYTIYKKDWLRGYKKINPTIEANKNLSPKNIIPSININNQLNDLDILENSTSMSDLRLAIKRPLENAKIYFNSPAVKERFTKFSTFDNGVRFPEVTSDIPIYTFNKNNEIKAISNHPIPSYNITKDELKMRNTSAGYAHDYGIFIKHPENTPKDIQKFSDTLTHELYHWYSDFNTPTTGFKPMNEILPTKNVLGREKDFMSYTGISPEGHPMREIEKRLLIEKPKQGEIVGKTDIREWISNPSEIKAESYLGKQKLNLGKFGEPLKDVEVEQLYNIMNPYFKNTASKKDITDYLKLIPVATGAAYITNKTNEK